MSSTSTTRWMNCPVSLPTMRPRYVLERIQSLGRGRPIRIPRSLSAHVNHYGATLIARFAIVGRDLRFQPHEMSSLETIASVLSSTSS